MQTQKSEFTKAETQEQKLLQESVPVTDEWKPSADTLRGKSTMKTES